MTRNEVLLDYFDKFPNIQRYGKDQYVSLEWIDKDIKFGITDNPLGAGGVIFRDVLGNEIKAHSFMFNAMFKYSDDTMKMLENSEFFEDLEYWIKTNNRKGILPEFTDGWQALTVRVMQTPYLFMVDPNNAQAQYTMILQLEYKERR